MDPLKIKEKVKLYYKLSSLQIGKKGSSSIFSYLDKNLRSIFSRETDPKLQMFKKPGNIPQYSDLRMYLEQDA